MSFFIARQQATKAATKPRGAPLGGGRGVQQAAALQRLGCAGCPLNKAPVITPKMLPTLKKGGKIYFLAEAPGRDEDERTGRPLTGASGSLLRECIPDDVDCSFDNVVNCRPPKNRDPEFAEIECCRPRRTKYIQEAKPLLIVGLGRIPLHAVLGSHDLQGMRGRLFAVQFGEHKCWFLPTYHPSFVLRVAKNKRKPLNSMMGHCFRMDLKRAFEYVEWLGPPQILTEKELRSGVKTFDGSRPTDLQECLDLLLHAGEAKEKAIDIETKGLRPYKPDAAIMSAAFSFTGVNFSFALDHPKASWSTAQKRTLKKALKAAVSTDTIKIAHNAPFEIEWLVWYLGREIIQHHNWHCTQMECHFLDERRGKAKSTDEQDRRAAYQALKFLVKQHFGLDHKSIFKLDKKDMSKSDLGETLIYNGADTMVTLMLHKWQTKLLKHFGLYEAYMEALPRQTSAAMMQFLGVHVDQKEVKKAQNKLKPEIKQLEANIADLKVVKAYVKDHKEFNPGSQDHVVEIFKDYLKRPEVEIKQERYEAHDFNKSSASKKRYDDGKGTRYSVDKNVLDQIDHPLAQLIVDWRNRTKLKSTYIDEFELSKGGLIYPDGLIHCNFNMTFAETGRTCVAGNTILETTKGNFEIQTLDLTGTHKNAHIKTHAGNTQKIEKLWYKGREPMYQLQFSDGSHITCTARHRLLTPNGWVFAGSLKVGEGVSTTNSVTWGDHQPRATQSFWRSATKHQNINGKRFCLDNAPSLLPSDGLSRIYRPYIENAKLFSLLVPSKVSRGTQVCHQQELRHRCFWKQTGGAAPTGETEFHPFTKLVVQRNGLRENSYRIENNSFHDKTQHILLWPQWGHPSTPPFWQIDRIGIINNGRIKSWFEGSNKPSTLLQRPDTCFPYALQKFSEWVASARKNASFGAQHCVAKESTGTRSVLVKKSWRSQSGTLSTGEKYQTSPPMAVYDKKWGTLGRFLFARRECSLRDRWGPAYVDKIRNERQNKSTSIDRHENSDIQNIGHTSALQLRESHQNSFRTIALTSVKYVGVQDVWDITVQGDHSYVAQGLIHHNSSDDPNMQNFPKRQDEWVRNQVAAPDGHVLVAFDFGQLEGCTAAMCSKDKAMIKALWEDYDFHYEWGEKLAYAYPEIIGGSKYLKDKDRLKKLRSKAKNKLVFPAIFGAQNSSIAGYLDVPEEIIEDLMDEFWKTFYGLADWQNSLMKGYYNTGYVESPTGRRRHYPMTRNQAINDPIQSVACDIVCRGMNTLSELAAEEQAWHLHPIMNIHDDLTLCMPDDDKLLEQAIEDVYKIMLTPGYDFINVPLSVTGSIGKHWYQMQEIGKFWSHRDI